MTKIESLNETAEIITNKAFQRLAEKTQVLYPKNGRKETVQNRLTHSYEVANAAALIANFIILPNKQIDYTNSLQNICLLHDIGHPPFGHDGATILHKKFKKLGLEEGFDDNSNNFIVIDKNQIKISDYTKASLIKYPDRLYFDQKKELHRILDIAIKQDIKYFENSVKIYEQPKRTILCEIMDEADRNSYVTSDLADCFSLGMSSSKEIDRILEEEIWYDKEIILFLISLSNAIKNKDKSLIKKVLKDLRVKLSLNYYLGDNLQLKIKNKELLFLREKLFQIEKNIFIFSKLLNKQRKKHQKIFNQYIDWVLNGNYPSSTYKTKIDKSKNKIEKLKLIRNMIAETTDWYVFQKVKEIK